MMDELNYFNHYKLWISNGKRFTIEHKAKYSDSYQSYDQPLIPNQEKNARSNGKNKEEAKCSAIGSQNERRDATKTSEEQPIDANKQLEVRIGRRFFAQSRSSNGRFRGGFRDKVYANKTQTAVREKVSTNSDHKVSDDKTQTKVFERKTYRSVDRNEGNNDSTRSGRHRERRSRSKTRQ
jgi:hypothetical protein